MTGCQAWRLARGQEPARCRPALAGRVGRYGPHSHVDQPGWRVLHRDVLLPQASLHEEKNGEHKLDAVRNERQREEEGSRRGYRERTRRFGAKEEDSDNDDDRTDGLKESRESPAPGGVEPVTSDDGKGDPRTRSAADVEEREEAARGSQSARGQ
jgi:hypothetical protein